MFKTIDLFAGAGGLSLGFTQTNEFELLVAVENNKNAQKTYLRNHKGISKVKIIEDIIGYPFEEMKNEIGDIDVIIGGPPCQGFSNANRQKNHVVSMNNGLVKEYFRAILELKPRAFVMENVGMLSSKTHRFYDSEIDHEKVINMGINMQDDEIIISKQNIEGIDLLSIIKEPNYIKRQSLHKELYQKLNVLYKNRNNKENRLVKFIHNNKTSLLKEIENYYMQNKDNDDIKFIVDNLEVIKVGINNNYNINSYETELSSLLNYQKALKSATEIYNNKLKAQFEQDEKSGQYIAHVKSYSVIDYIEAILGNEYKQKGGIINAIWFGVPQERKRYIIIGIRKDIIGEEEIVLPICPEGELPIYAVKDAIEDLKNYATSYNKEAEAIPMGEIPDGISDYAMELRDSNELNNHVITETTPVAMKRFIALKEGENFHNLDDSLKTTYSEPDRTQNTIYLKLENDKPCGTVVNVRKSMWIHPELDRAISIREAARLQSFPDSFIFCGTKDSQYQQIGNAVPPKMAKGIAQCLLKQLK